MKWPLVNLPDICRPKQWPTIQKAEMLDSGYPVFGANGRIGYYSTYNHEEPTILITCRGATCGTINVCEPKSYVTGNAMALDRLDECRANLRFITRALESADFSSVITGVAQPQITRESLSRLQIPLPPLAEQKRIAAILDAADALRAKRRESLAQLDTLLQSTFLDMFGDPVINPMGWEVVQLGDVANFHAGSTLPDGEEFTGQLGGFLYLKVGDLNHPDNMTAIVRANLWAASRAKGIMAPADSILIPKRGGAIGTNKKRLLTRQAVLDPNLMAISAGDGMSHQYILRWFHTFDLMSIASGSSVPQLNKKDLAPLRIPRPPFGIQLRFATIVESVEQQKARLREHLAELDTLFASLQQRAFNGDL